MKKMSSIGMAALIPLLTGCAQDGPFNDSREAKSMPTPIVFTPMTFDNGITRAAQATRESVTSYGVSCAVYPAAASYSAAGCGSYFHNEQIDASSGECGYYWPGTDFRVSFYAYAPYGNDALTITSTKSDPGMPTYHCIIPTSIAEQPDFITANALDILGTGRKEPVPLTFSHRCADLRFKVYNQGGAALTVKSIAVYGVKYEGTYQDKTWTLNDTPNSEDRNPFILSLSTSIDAETTVDATGSSNHFIILPQTVAAGTDIFVVKTEENGVNKTYTHGLATDLQLEMGKSYTFKLVLGDGLLTVDSETDIQEWGVEVKYLSTGMVGVDNTWSQPSIGSGKVFGAETWEEDE